MNKRLTHPIAVVEDDRVTAELMRQILTRWGFQVQTYPDGVEALENLLKPSAPRLILMDWMLPGRSGIEVVTQLRQKLHDPFHVIMTTGKDDITDVIEAMRSGADDFIIKPVDPQYLRLRIISGLNSLISRRALQSERESHLVVTRMSSLSYYLSEISNEMSRPIQSMESVIQNIELLRINSQKSSESLPMLDHCRSFVHQMKSITNQMERLILEVNQESFRLIDLTTVTQNVLEMLRERFNFYQITFALSGFDDECEIEGSPAHLSMALTNLILDGLEEMRTRPDKQISVKIERADTNVKLTIDDKGAAEDPSAFCALPPKSILDQIGFSSTALNRAVAEMVVQRHRGVLEFATSDKSNRFCLTLPRRQIEHQSIF